MAYQHKLVSDLETPEQILKRHALDGEEATLSKWTIDGFPVSKNLYTLATDLRRVCPNYKFGAVASLLTHSSFIGWHMRSLYVYVDSCEYTLGRIGWGSFRVGSGDDVYMVYSRTIANKKIKDHREQHYMLVTTDPKRAVVNAAKSLRPYTGTDIAKFSAELFSSSVRGAMNEPKTRLRNVISKCVSTKAVTDELTHLIRLGNVSFVTPEFKEAAASMMAIDAEIQEAEARGNKIGSYFIRFQNTAAGMLANVLTYNTKAAASITSKPSEETTIKAADLPYDIQQKIAVLSMNGENAYVPGLGMKVTDTSYWLEKEIA